MTGLDFEHALGAVARHARVTPLIEDPGLSERFGRPVLFKTECLQHTGSFKVRGAAARLEALGPGERAAGVVTCSSGNHGRAVAFVAGRMGVPATIYVPEWVDPVKLHGIRAAGAEAVLRGATFDESEALALEAAGREGRPYVSAYDDPWVIAGQGTIALEILDQLDGVAPAAVVAPLSGGGLIGGIAAALRARLGEKAPRALAASAENAAVMLASVRAGRPVALEERPTLANALAGGIGPDNRHSFELVRTLAHAHATVAEDRIAEAMRYAVSSLRLVVEGGAAVALASVLADSWTDLPEGPLVAVLSGGNVSASTLARVLRQGTSARVPS